MAWVGPALPRRLSEAELSAERALLWCEEACRLLAALAAFGLELPDAAPARFSVDAEERLWLVDLWNVAEVPAGNAALAHVERARALCREILGALALDVLPQSATGLLEAAKTFAELESALGAAR